ncbi:hypothetical protein P5609_018550 [Bacillus licheniformis]
MSKPSKEKGFNHGKNQLQKLGGLTPYDSKVCEACGCEKPLPKSQKITDRIVLTAAGVVGILTIVLILGTIFSYLNII